MNMAKGKKIKTLTENVGTKRLAIEDIKRCLDTNMKEDDKIRRVEGIVASLYE